MLTNTQQKILQSITEQFEKLNASQPKTKYNLVDIQPLIDKSDKIRQLDEEEKTAEKMWRDIQDNEIKRIADLLREDLPEDRILIKPNFYGSQLKICRIRFLSNGELFINDHPDSCVTISVYLKKKDYWDEYSYKWRDEYTNLYYKLNYKDVEYSTIEELCATDEFKETLRKRVL